MKSTRFSSLSPLVFICRSRPEGKAPAEPLVFFSHSRFTFQRRFITQPLSERSDHGALSAPQPPALRRSSASGNPPPGRRPQHRGSEGTAGWEPPAPPPHNRRTPRRSPPGRSSGAPPIRATREAGRAAEGRRSPTPAAALRPPPSQPHRCRHRGLKEPRTAAHRPAPPRPVPARGCGRPAGSARLCTQPSAGSRCGFVPPRAAELTADVVLTDRVRDGPAVFPHHPRRCRTGQSSGAPGAERSSPPPRPERLAT